MNPTIRTSFLSFIEQKGESIPIHSQQYGELSVAEKRDRLTQWLDNDPIYFFSLVRSHLPAELVTLWNQQAHSPTTRTSNSNESSRTPSHQHAIIRNRRYHYLIQHLRHSDYFSEDTLQLRVPSLYQEYIGKYIPDSERYAPFRNEVSLVDRIYTGMDRQYVQDQWKRKQRSEEEQFEEQEDEDEDDEEDQQKQTTTTATPPSPLSELSMNHLIDLRQEKKDELIRLLEEQWMDGMDDQFDYSVVDDNDTFDDLVQQNQDMQDKYFDDELEEENGLNHDTGVLDY